MKKVLLAGGAGFIGYHLLKYLARKGNEVTIIDNLFRRKMDSELKEIIKIENVKYIEADMAEGKFFEKLHWQPKIPFSDLVKIVVDADMRKVGLVPVGDGDEILKQKFPNRWWKVN